MARWRGKTHGLAELIGKERAYTYMYSPTTRTQWKSGEYVKAVRWREGGEYHRGWLTQDNKILTESGIKQLLRAIESTGTYTTYKKEWNVGSLEARWDDLTPSQKTEWLDIVAKKDWKSWWNEYYPVVIDSNGNERKTPGDVLEQSEKLYALIESFGIVGAFDD